MKAVHRAVNTGSVLLGLEASTLGDASSAMLDMLIEQKKFPAELKPQLLAKIVAREKESSCAIGNALAVPHAYLDGIPEPRIIFARLSRPIHMGAPDHVPTRYVFMLLGPPGRAKDHLDSLSSIARLMADEDFRYEAGEASTPEEVDQAIVRFEERSKIEEEGPPVKTQEDGLQYTGRIGGGVMRDIRRHLVHYKSDLKDGLHPKVVSATAFLFFACLAPAVTFGGVMADQTGGQIGAVEMLVATAICGTIYSLFSGQPLVILGGTGPLLIITAILYELCVQFDVPFLPVYAWVGVWSGIFTIILAVTDAGALMRYFTRFTDEIFAALISLIFIYEAVKSLLGFFDLGPDSNHDAAFLSLLLGLGCFYIAHALLGFRSSRYLHRLLREFVADFGPTIALGAMTLIALSFSEIDIEGLKAPDEFGTTSGRGWLVDVFAAPKWIWAASMLPALLVAILVFLDQNITARVVNASDHRLKKGPAYHLDLGLVGVLIMVCSVIGLPWLVAATVRSLNHVKALATTESITSHDGSPPRDRIIHVRENRVAAFAIHILIALSLFALPVIKQIPMAVLYGLFLYMGVVSLRGNQFFERLLLLPTDSRLYPRTHYIRRVPMRLVHVFTLVQLGCLIVLWLVKTSAIAILFPIFIALGVPVRLLLNRFMKPDHLAALDSDETPEDEEDRIVP